MDYFYRLRTNIEYKAGNIANPRERIAYLLEQDSKLADDHTLPEAISLRNRIKNMIKLAELEILQPPAPPPAKTGTNKTTRSYRWQGTPDELTALFNNIKAVLIPTNTPENDFKAIFQARPLNEIKPVRWHDNNATELIYFITMAEMNYAITRDGWEYGQDHSTHRANYVLLSECFVKNDGSKFDTKVFPQTKRNMHENLSKKKQEFIKNLF